LHLLLQLLHLRSQLGAYLLDLMLELLVDYLLLIDKRVDLIHPFLKLLLQISVPLFELFFLINFGDHHPELLVHKLIQLFKSRIVWLENLLERVLVVPEALLGIVNQGVGRQTVRAGIGRREPLTCGRGS
jgi:hypothetical protein